MNIKKAILTASVLLLVCSNPAWAQKVYKCVSGGQVTYSGNPGKGCTEIKNSAISVISGPSSEQAAPGYSNETPQSTTPSSTVDSGTIAQAETEYQNALKALEDGKAVRYGNEKNYAKYQERIQQLQNAVDAAQQKLNKLKTGG